MLKPWSPESSKTPVKDSVKTKSGSESNSSRKRPQLKQTKLLDFLKRKSPKAMKARENRKPEPETEPIKLQGALKSPLSGDLSHPGPQNNPSEGPGPVPEERGRGWGKDGKKRAEKVLERWLYDPGPGSLGPQQGKPVKRLRRAMPKEEKTRKPASRP